MRTLLILLFITLPFPAMAVTDDPAAITSAVDCDATDPECDADYPADATDDPFSGEVDPLAIDSTLALDNSGMLDGIYRCDMTYGSDGQSRSQIYVSVNGKSNGDAVFIIGEIEVRSDAYFGWGIGRVADETDGNTFHFSGNTSEGESFALTASYQEDDSVLASGEAVVMFRTAGGEKVGVKTQLSCQSIW